MYSGRNELVDSERVWYNQTDGVQMNSQRLSNPESTDSAQFFIIITQVFTMIFPPEHDKVDFRLLSPGGK